MNRHAFEILQLCINQRLFQLFIYIIVQSFFQTFRHTVCGLAARSRKVDSVLTESFCLFLGNLFGIQAFGFNIFNNVLQHMPQDVKHDRCLASAGTTCNNQILVLPATNSIFLIIIQIHIADLFNSGGAWNFLSENTGHRFLNVAFSLKMLRHIQELIRLEKGLVVAYDFREIIFVQVLDATINNCVKRFFQFGKVKRFFLTFL